MNRKTRWIVLGTAAVVVVAGGAGVAVASSQGDDQQLSGQSLRQATQAALAHTKGGTVLEAEAGDDGAAYGVEVQLENGDVVEVALDADFAVIGQELDEDGSDKADGPEDG
jgi:uncharacterized membrane protein YkoI